MPHRTRMLRLEEPIRFPLALTEEDLASAHRVIALKEAEHRRKLMRQFPDWPERVHYWHIHEQATAEIEKLVAALVASLREETRECTNR